MVAILSTTAACTPAATRGAQAARAVLSNRLAAFLDDPALRHSGTALLVVSLDRGDTLFSREIDRLYTPASNRKLFTAASALHHLGPGYRFRTELIAVGAIVGDTLQGDLVLVGAGDPDFTTAHVAALADSVVVRGIRSIAGDVRGDDSRFDDVEWGAGWMWDDGPYWYWPYISALSVNDNSLELTVAPGDSIGAPVSVAVAPPTSYVEIRSTATTVSAEAEASLDIDRHWSPKANIIDITGTLPIGGEPVEAIRTVEEPALYAATLLGELLTARGVHIAGSNPGPALPDTLRPRETIGHHLSEPLSASVRNLLKESDNLTAELLVKTVGAHVSGAPGSFDTGLAAEASFLASEVGVDTLAVRLADGSGVSRYNLVTARQIVTLLSAMDRHEELRAPFYDALPIAGVDGTLDERMRGTAAEGQARAKTGSLSGVSTLSGYVPTATGERLAFSLMMAFFVGETGPRRAVQDSIVAALAAFRR